MNAALVSQTIPVAAMTGGAVLGLRAVDDESSAKRCTWSRPVEIIGVLVTVALNGPEIAGRRNADLDDIEVRIAGTDVRPTRAITEDATAGEYVDAKALSLPYRYLGLKLPGSPDCQVQARWKNIAHAAVFNDCVVSVTFLYNFDGGPQ